MKKIVFLAAALAVLSTPAFALGDSNINAPVNTNAPVTTVAPVIAPINAPVTTVAPVIAPVVAPVIAPVNTNAQQQGQTQNSANTNTNANNSSASTSNANNASQSTYVDAHQEADDIPVSTAYAPGLAQGGNDVCMGSSSLGAQGAAFGVSFGSTWHDDNCERLKNSRELRAAGYGKAANALLCQSPAVAKAMADAGTPCAGSSTASATSYTTASADTRVVNSYAKR